MNQPQKNRQQQHDINVGLYVGQKQTCIVYFFYSFPRRQAMQVDKTRTSFSLTACPRLFDLRRWVKPASSPHFKAALNIGFVYSRAVTLSCLKKKKKKRGSKCLPPEAAAINNPVGSGYSEVRQSAPSPVAAGRGETKWWGFNDIQLCGYW